MSSFRLVVLTPYRRLYEGEAEAADLPAHDGRLTVLAGHEALAAPLAAGPLELRSGGARRVAALAGGFFRVGPEGLEVFAESGEWAEEIDEARAKAALERALARLDEAQMPWSRTRAESAAARARARLAALARAAAAGSAGAAPADPPEAV